jgi:signal transduction histidine kinase/ActR/RegA family two-component response regulator
MVPSAGVAPQVVDLESVIITAELSRRASRPPDYQGENRMLVSLMHDMMRSPEAILHSLAQATLTSCKAGSAGISLIEEDGRISRWHALVGELAAHLWSTTPRSFSPCGTVVDRNSVQLFSLPERHFRYFSAVKPLIVEALLIPFGAQGKPVGTIWAVTHDEQRHFDAEDARLIDNLGKFAAAAYQLRASLAVAEDASRRKDEFLAVLSHELRSPLAAMQVVSDVLASRRSEHEDVARASGVMQRQLAHLGRLIGDAVDVARISRGKLDLRKQRVALSSIVEGALEISKPMIDMAGHSLNVTLASPPAFVDGDPVRLTQVVANLLNNAAKFTPDGGHLEVSAEAQGTQAVVRVQDDGIGIASSMLGSIFELYAQVRPSDAAPHALPAWGGGEGIGLALARSLVELHGGRLEAQSAGLAKGSEFVVRLPLSATPAQPPVALSPQLADASPKLRILVVDDHRDTADSLAWVLHSIGHEARAEYDGRSALQAVEEYAPDVIIQDLGLPHMSGYEIARQMRMHAAARDALLVAVTGYAAEVQPEGAAAFDGFLVKPVGLAALEEMLSSASSRRGKKSLNAAGREAAD